MTSLRCHFFHKAQEQSHFFEVLIIIAINFHLFFLGVLSSKPNVPFLVIQPIYLILRVSTRVHFIESRIVHFVA